MTRRRSRRRFSSSPFGVDPWGTTAEFESRIKRKVMKEFGLAPERSKYQQLLINAKRAAPKDWRVDALYADRDRFNREEPTAKNDPFEVDHIRPLHQGGEHTRENLRIIRRSKNCEYPQTRSEEEIKVLLVANAIRIKIWGR